MIDSCVIIGCGTLGSCLSIELAKTKKVSSLKLIDFDCINGKSYPFMDYEIHCSKVEVVRFLCLLENPAMVIDAIQEKITPEHDLDGLFIIDCRDRKDSDIKSNVKLSMDGSFLCIDSRSTFEPTSNPLYSFQRNERLINIGIQKIIDYLNNHNYLYHDFRLIDLDLQRETIIS